MKKTTIFWQNLSLWLQSCQILTSENNLHLETALGLKPDSSNFKLQINFCCLLAKQHIWICRLRELHPTQNNFVIYLKHIHLLEKHRHAKRARVIFLVIGVFVELFTVMIWFSFFGLRCTARRKLEIYNL